jgi:hypothetical protein
VITHTITLASILVSILYITFWRKIKDAKDIENIYSY